MSRLNKELGLLQGIALLSTSLLGTGIFVVPALAATAAGEASLWAWMLLIALVLPVAFTCAQLGRHFPHAGGAPHLIGRAFGARMERLSALLFLAVLPVGLPAALNIASGFWQALFDLSRGQALAIQLATLAAMLLLGQRPANFGSKFDITGIGGGGRSTIDCKALHLWFSSINPAVALAPARMAASPAPGCVPAPTR